MAPHHPIHLYFGESVLFRYLLGPQPHSHISMVAELELASPPDCFSGASLLSGFSCRGRKFEVHGVSGSRECSYLLAWYTTHIGTVLDGNAESVRCTGIICVCALFVVYGECRCRWGPLLCRQWAGYGGLEGFVICDLP